LSDILFKDVKKGDTVLYLDEVKLDKQWVGKLSFGSFYLPAEVIRVTSKRFVVRFDEGRFKGRSPEYWYLKKDGSVYGRNDWCYPEQPSNVYFGEESISNELLPYLAAMDKAVRVIELIDHLNMTDHHKRVDRTKFQDEKLVEDLLGLLDKLFSSGDERRF